MRIEIPDDVIEHYLPYAAQSGSDVTKLVVSQLRRFARLNPTKKAIVISAAVEADLTARLGEIPLKDGDDLLLRVNKLAGVSFMSYDIQLTLPQLQELDHRAQRQGRPPEALIQDIWQYLKGNFFYESGGGVAALPSASQKSA